VQKFRELIRTLNVLKSFTEFSWDQLDVDEQIFEDYKSKYLDIYDQARLHLDEGSSIIDDVDFELELIHRDEINVAYILDLLAKLHRARQEESVDKYEEIKKTVLNLLGQETQLRSKRELIVKFIDEQLPILETGTVVREAFAVYWTDKEATALNALCAAEDMDREALDALIRRFHFTGKEPLREDIFSALNSKPKVLQRKTIYERIVAKIKELVQTFDDDMGDL
jgi:type I restriction enzyme R subunit